MTPLAAQFRATKGPLRLLTPLFRLGVARNLQKAFVHIKAAAESEADIAVPA